MDQKPSTDPESSTSSADRIAASDPHSARSGQRPRLIVVHDSLQSCPYLEGRVARMPLEYPRQTLSPEDLDELLHLGYRRSGSLLYRTRCPQCNECIPTRVDVNRFRTTRSMKRVWNRGSRELRFTWGPARVDASRLRIFNSHRLSRSLSSHGPAGAADYRDFLVSTCVQSAEIAFWFDERLIGVAIVDLGQRSINAVYTHFDPHFGRYSIGTLAVLEQIRFARESGRTHVYLGLYVAANDHLNYKARFTPQQRLIAGRWCDVQEAPHAK